MSDLVAFLRARLDEDKAAADALDVVLKRNGWSGGSLADRSWAEAGRRILDELAGYFAEFGEEIDHGEKDGQPWEVRVAWLLALPYSDHPDYDPKWQPREAQ